MKLLHSAAIILFSFTASMAGAQGFSLGECLNQHSKEECSQKMLLEEQLSKPLASGAEVEATSGKYTITVQGENWLKNGWEGKPEKAKDLGLVKESGQGMINYEASKVAEADFEVTLTNEMKELYKGLETGFRKGKIDIKANSQLELLPLTITGGSGMLARLCYTIEVKTPKAACVYEGFVTRGGEDTVKFLGSVGDFDDMRAELEGIISSFKYKTQETAPVSGGALER